MAATTDWVHDEAVVDAVIDRLEASLPATWTSGQNPHLRLKRIEFGDLSSYELPPNTTIDDLCPSILVYADRSENRTEVYGGIGGKEGEVIPVRVTHFWHRSQCRDLNDLSKWIQPARSQAQRAKVVNKALWQTRTVGAPTLTTDDTSAKVVVANPGGIMYGTDDTGDIITLSIDLTVATRTE